MNNRNSEKYFLYTGNAYPHKNLNRLIKAIVELNSELTEKVCLKIVSSRNVFTQRLEQDIQKENAQGFVRLLGFVEDEKLKGLFKNSVAFVFPSLSEGFGLPGIEAMENSTLVLASDIPVFKEIYDDHAIYFNPMDTDSIANTLKNTLNMPGDERINRINNGLKFVKRYSWSEMAKKTLNVYNAAVK